jgi:predicted PurR-regulated permease PerM
MSHDPDRTKFTWVYWLLLAGAIVTLGALWLPLLLAAWFGHLVRPLVDRMQKRFGKRRTPAVWVAMGVFILALVPITVSIVQVIFVSTDLLNRAMQNSEWRASLQSLVAADGEGHLTFSDVMSPRRMLEIVQQHGGMAISLLTKVFGMTTAAVIQIFVFFLSCYAFLSDGGKQWSWIVEHSPFDGQHMERMRKVFYETGRGIIIGIGLTALTQAIVATVSYVALGVPRALLLGELTFFAAFIPTFGTAIVWVPIAAGLALSGQYLQAGVLAFVGMFVIGTIDNILRPVFSKWGNLDLPVYVLIISIFGGFTVFGAWGFILGPLFVRLAKEVLVMAREER